MTAVAAGDGTEGRADRLTVGGDSYLLKGGEHLSGDGPLGGEIFIHHRQGGQ